MKNFLKNFLILTICFSTTFGNYFAFFTPQKTSAAETTTAKQGDGEASETPDDSNLTDKETIPIEAQTLTQHVYNSQINTNGFEDINDLFASSSDPKIILNADDASAVRSLSCMSSLIPNFATNTKKLFEILPSSSRPSTEAELSALKLSNSDKFYSLVSQAQNIWYENNEGFILNDMSTLECLSGLSANEIVDLRARDPQQLTTIINDSKESLTIDIRVLKTLIYLVTPKNQGGAGHYRIKVARIRTGYTSKSRQTSRESNYIVDQLNSSTTTTTSSSDLSGETAAEIGMNRDISSSDSYDLDGTNATAIVEDENGDEYDAYINDQLQNEDESTDSSTSSDKTEKNISAHSEGKAIDISEVDDIRCTLIERKRVGHTSKTSYSQRPIKLAWQTQEGYAESGGYDGGDLGQLFKESASDEIRSLIEELGGDPSNYDGDLSQGNFSDIVQVIGKSLFSQIINSPSSNFSGYDFQDTLQKIGSVYFADLLGLEKEIFVDQDITSLDDLQRVVGQAALEERLNLPFGTFTGDTLEDTLLNIGQRKIEYEMGLNSSSLNSLLNDNTQSLPLIVGEAAIEKALSLKEGSFTGNSFSELKKNVGEIKGKTIFIDTTYPDNILHLDSGTTNKLVSGQLSPIAYTTLVGQTRLDDTAYGFKYLSTHESAYNLPEGTWSNALLGKKDALKTIGVNTISKAFATDDEQRTAMEKWLISNTAKNSDDDCTINLYPEVNITVKDEDKTVAILEDNAIEAGLATGDFYKMFGCAKSNPASVFEKTGSKILYYALANYDSSSEEKFKIDLMDTNSEYKLLQNDQLEFYLPRIQEMNTTTNRITSNWEDQSSQLDYQPIMASLSHIKSIVGDSKYYSNKNTIQTASKKISIEIGILKSIFEKDQKEHQELKNKINSTHIDINRLTTLSSEILEGRIVPSTENIQLSQIPASGLTSDAEQYSESSSASGKTGKVGIMLLLARKIDPKDFFLSVGTDKTETELSLPQNSLYYYVQNLEKKGLSGQDAFYQSIGQAKIEEEFGMPSFYFQGSLYKITDKPDFQNDLDSLMKYNGFNQDDKLYDSTKDYIFQAKTKNVGVFNYYVQKAENKYSEGLAKYKKEINTEGSSKVVESTLNDLITNVKANGLTDGIRSAENDLLFRMGIAGNLQSLMNDSPIAWSTANKTASEIDKKLSLEDGTTRSLFTSSFVPLNDGKDILGENDKKIVSGKLEITTSAINKYLEALNGDIDPDDLTTAGQEITYNSSNPYAAKTDASTDNLCTSLFNASDNGISLSKQFVNDSFWFRDKDGIVFAQNQESAKQLRDQNSDKKITFLEEIAIGLAKVTGKSQSEVQNALLAYLKNGGQKTLFSFSDEQYEAMEKSSGIPKDILQKLFVRQNATQINNSLSAYKKAVGQSTAKKIINYKLFQGLGVSLDSTSFDSDSLYEIMNGNYKPLYDIGALLIDKKLNLPTGTITDITTASTQKMKTCALAEAGGGMLGGLIGLNYVSMKGDIRTNLGQSVIETTLNLPRGTFKGNSLDELVKSTSPVNFVLGFQIPIEGVVSSDIVQGIFGTTTAKMSSSDITDTMKLNQIKNYLEVKSLLSSSESKAVSNLDNKLESQIKLISSDSSKWTTNFQNRVKFLDNILGLSADTTKNMLTGGISPNAYLDMAAGKSLQGIAALNVINIFDLEEYQSAAAMNLVRNFGSMITNGQYNDIYSSLSDVFNVNLDAKAGFTKGTASNVLGDPKNAAKILLAEGIKKVDQSLGLDSNSDTSLTKLYDYQQTNLEQCKASILQPEQEAALKDEEIQLKLPNLTTNNDARLAEISNTRSTANQSYNDCKTQSIEEATTSSHLIFRTAVNDKISSAISNKISEITQGTIIMPKEDVSNFIKNGDMKYFETIGLAYAANIVLNKAGNNELVPPGMRITYKDLYLATFGDRNAEASAGDAAVYADVNNITYSDFNTPYRYGDVCGTLGSIGCLNADSYLSMDSSSALPRDESQLVAANQASTNAMYGYNPSDAATVSTASSKYQTKYGDNLTIANSDQCKQDPMSETCQKAAGALTNLNSVKGEARQKSRQTFIDDLKYKTTDALLWNLDKNVYPGLSYALLRGDATVKQNAMANYIRNGIMRGELFGIDISSRLKNVGEWINTYDTFSDLTSAVSNGGLDSFFQSGGGYTALNDFVNNNSKNWFGFDMPENMLGGLTVGLSTGVWDASKLDLSDSRLIKFDGGIYKGTNGKLQIPTMTQIGKNLLNDKITDLKNGLEGKLFSWTDKILGWDSGTAYQTYQAYENVQKAREAYINIKDISGAAKAKAAADYDAAKAQLITFVVTTVFSKQIAAAEESLGLVSGTGSMLATMLITGFNPIGLITFVGMNLFMVYKVELKCSADGYYPEMQAGTSSNVVDVTGLGVWNGMSQETSKKKSIEAAQYKASRLIGDVLSMQDSPKYADVIPSQIMTGRQEDVDLWDPAITYYLCSKLGNTSIKGICGGNTRAGVWENPQTVALTHIGF
ncbi:MAG: hypothetical protein WC536_01940 [Patescibacteria group bacterium]